MKKFIISVTLPLLGTLLLASSISVESLATGLKASSFTSLPEMVNPIHLNNLSTTPTLPNGQQALFVAIYSNYPDYNPVIAPGEGASCVDDVSRAAIFYAECYKKTKNPQYLTYVEQAANFMLYLQAPNGYFYNFVNPDMSINTTGITSVAGSNFWAYRAFYSLCYIYPVIEKNNPQLAQNIKNAATKLYGNIPTVLPQNYTYSQQSGINVPNWIPNQAGDQSAVILLGLKQYYEYMDKTPSVLAKMRCIADGLVAFQVSEKSSPLYGMYYCWQNQWHAWGAAQAFALLDSSTLLDKTYHTQKYLQSPLLYVNHFQQFLKNQGYPNVVTANVSGSSVAVGTVTQYSQIAYGFEPLISADLEAYRLQYEKKYATLTAETTNWFFGNNPAKAQVYSLSNGIVFDGIDSLTSVNLNSGAESTIEALTAMIRVSNYPSIVSQLSIPKE